MRKVFYGFMVIFVMSFLIVFGVACDHNTVNVAGDGDGGEEILEADAIEEELPPCDPFPPAQTGGDGADLTAPLPVGHAVAGKIKTEEQVPPGIKSWAEVGDILIRNSKVGFVIENTGGGEGYRSDGYNPYGGEFVNADLWSETGPAGKSMMGEIFYGIGIQIVDPATVTVMNDGTDGNPAVVRVTGPLRPMPLLDLAAGSLLNPRPFGGELIIDYVLGGNDEFIKVKYTIRNTYNRVTRLMLPTLGTIFGDGLQIFTPEGGFDDNKLGGSHDYYGFVGKEISYAIVDGRGGQLNYVLEESNVLATTLSSFIELPACGEAEIDAFNFVVAGGGVEALKGAIRRMKGEGELPQLSGNVTIAGSTPAVGARVHIMTGDGTYVTSDICDENGSYEVSLAPGDYTVTAVLEGHAVRGPLNVNVGSSGGTLDIDFDQPGTVHYTVKDGDDSAIPAKIIVFPEYELPALPASFGENTYPGGAYQYVFDVDGAGDLVLPAGSYRIFASRGFFYETDEKQVNVSAGGSENVELRLIKSVDSNGFLCGDFHQHSVWSPDSWTLPEDVVAANIGEGLDIIVSTDHDWIADYQYVVDDLGLGDRVVAFGGEEITSYQYGHFNPYPLTRNPDARNDGAIEHYYRQPADVFADALDDPLHPVLQVNHPRSEGSGGYFNYVQLDPVTCTPGGEHPDWWSELWNVVEIFNGSDFRSNESDENTRRTVEDWFGLLNCGKRFTATGNSDSHSPIKSELGYPRNCLYFGFDSPSMVTSQILGDAVRSMKNVISGGAFISIDVQGAGMGETAEVPGGRATAHIVVQAPEWMSLDRMRIFVSGEEVQVIQLNSSTQDPLNPVIRYNDSIAIDTGGHDGWIIVEVEGDTPMDPVVRGKLPFAATNPVFIHAI